MMVEAQIGICDLNHRVVDIESMIQQIPEVINDHRRHIASLYGRIDTLKESAATKSDVRQIERELGAIKWAFTITLGIILALLGAIFSRVLWL